MHEPVDVIQLGIFASRIAAICDEMGSVLRRSAFSPNIRDRLDFSCAVFDAEGELCAQAAHIPVHLGSMAYAMRSIVSTQRWRPGDMLVVNDPFLGGTHLPDVTVIAPVFVADRCVAFVANRAHHANIGAISPGSMPISSTLEQEGVVIAPSLIMQDERLNRPLLNQLAGLPSSLEWDEQHLPDHPALGDFLAQISSNRAGVASLTRWVCAQGAGYFADQLRQLNDYGERLARAEIKKIPAGVYRAEDCLDDDGLGRFDIVIKLQLKITADGSVEADFTGSAQQVEGNVNCPLSVAAAAVFYVFRCLMPSYAPACAGLFRPIKLFAPSGSLVNANRPAAVAAGNVETSTRIVDVVLKALAEALPQR
ncbi:MAG TPA: hydantoinase B/oxoprolinase family protein, partial [Pseudomonadales bacterium]|nr:hydantoinase B/oxoprolinase family protein [Pseudomonadales bacterium]